MTGGHSNSSTGNWRRRRSLMSHWSCCPWSERRTSTPSISYIHWRLTFYPASLPKERKSWIKILLRAPVWPLTTANTNGYIGVCTRVSIITVESTKVQVHENVFLLRVHLGPHVIIILFDIWEMWCFHSNSEAAGEEFIRLQSSVNNPSPKKLIHIDIYQCQTFTLVPLKLSENIRWNLLTMLVCPQPHWQRRQQNDRETESNSSWMIKAVFEVLYQEWPNSGAF